MKIRILILFAALFFSSCTKQHPLMIPGSMHVNLIQNESFESAGNPDLSHWYSDYPQAGDSVLNDTPPGGGFWSLRLEPQWLPSEGFREQAVAIGPGTGIYTLSCWIKNFNWTGSMSLRLRRAGITVTIGQVTNSDSVWTYISRTDTVTTLPMDTLIVHLSDGSTEVASGWSAYDRVSLIRN